MANATADADAAQTDPDGGEGGDKPPHRPTVSSSSAPRPLANKDIPLHSSMLNLNLVSNASHSPATPALANGSDLNPMRQGDNVVAKHESRHQSASLFVPPKGMPSARKPIAQPSARPPPSQASTEASQKFTLKDLIPGAGLGRRTSNRSASSRRSDSERGHPNGGELATASLAKKYGVCERLAIGKGATSVVRIVHKWDSSEDKLYAVKVLPLSLILYRAIVYFRQEFRKRRKNETEKEYVKKLTAEFCISSTLHHPNIVETVDLVQDEQHRWCEVMEYCPGGDLYAAIKKGGMSTSEVECCFKQILCGLEYLHAQGVAHRDIKPENLFFDSKGFLKV